MKKLPPLRKALLIYNPHSGRAVIKTKLHSIVRIITRAGFLTTVFPSSRPGDLRKLIRRILASCGSVSEFPYDRLIVCGGDGTLHEAVCALMELRSEYGLSPEDMIPISYIPAGSTNDFAVSHTIPTAPLDAARALVKGSPVLYDLGLFNDTYFSYVAAFGFFTDVPYDTPQPVKNILGHAAYLLEGARRLPAYRPVSACVTADGEEIRGSFFAGLILNTTHVAGFTLHNASISLQDGLFELVLIPSSLSPSDLLATLTAVLKEDFSSPHMIYRKVKSVLVDTKTPLSWTLDGEYGGTFTHASLSVCKGALPFVIQEADPAPPAHNT